MAHSVGVAWAVFMEWPAPHYPAQDCSGIRGGEDHGQATRPTMRLVTLKSEAQLDLQVLHRARQRLVTGRTRLTNQLRAVLLERGVILPKRRAPLIKRLDELMEGDLPISPRALRLLEDLRDEWAELDRRIKAYGDELTLLTRDDEMARRLATVPAQRDQRHNASGSCRRRISVLQGARLGRLARADAAAALDPREDKAAGDQQARHQLPAHAADPWCTGRHVPLREQAYAHGGVGTSAADAGTPERHRGCSGQTGLHRMDRGSSRQQL